MDPLTTSLRVAASGLTAQSERLRVVAENMANAQSTANSAQEDPYTRKTISFGSLVDRQSGVSFVSVASRSTDPAEFPTEYMPGHQAADENGYVKTPNVNGMIEAMDMREAQRSYEANLNLIQASRRMISQTIDILRK